jgi:hypothetical protein
LPIISGLTWGIGKTLVKAGGRVKIPFEDLRQKIPGSAKLNSRRQWLTANLSVFCPVCVRHGNTRSSEANLVEWPCVHNRFAAFGQGGEPQ